MRSGDRSLLSPNGVLVISRLGEGVRGGFGIDVRVEVVRETDRW